MYEKDNVTLPLVSVIIRSMDRPTLSDALDSVALQTYSNLEVLVVNAKGGHHSEIGTTCGVSPLRLINQGGLPLRRSQAGNIGLVAVQGAYFSFLDDDDTFDPEHFSRLVAALKASDQEILIYAGVRCIDRSDSERKILNLFAERYEEGKLLAGNFIPIHAPLVPSKFLQRGIFFDESLDVYEDWDFWLQIARYYRFTLADQVTATYFINGGSGVNPITVDEERMRQATLTLYEKWLPRLTSLELWQLSRLYHDRNRALHISYRETELLKHNLAGVSSELAGVSGELAGVSDELAGVSDELARINDNLMHKQAELVSVYESSSWRITAPLRKLMQWLRSL
jgi:glycosyltransferase involved in cell wall biosynthesis